MSPFHHLSNFYVPFNILSNINPLRNLSKHLSPTERAPHLPAQWFCLPLDWGLLGGETLFIHCLASKHPVWHLAQPTINADRMDEWWINDATLSTSGIFSGLDIRYFSLGGEDIKSVLFLPPNKIVCCWRAGLGKPEACGHTRHWVSVYCKKKGVDIA